MARVSSRMTDPQVSRYPSPCASTTNSGSMATAAIASDYAWLEQWKRVWRPGEMIRPDCPPTTSPFNPRQRKAPLKGGFYGYCCRCRGRLESLPNARSGLSALLRAATTGAEANQTQARAEQRQGGRFRHLLRRDHEGCIHVGHEVAGPAVRAQPGKRHAVESV